MNSTPVVALFRHLSHWHIAVAKFFTGVWLTALIGVSHNGNAAEPAPKGQFNFIYDSIQKVRLLREAKLASPSVNPLEAPAAQVTKTSPLVSPARDSSISHEANLVGIWDGVQWILWVNPRHEAFMIYINKSGTVRLDPDGNIQFTHRYVHKTELFGSLQQGKILLKGSPYDESTTLTKMTSSPVIGSQSEAPQAKQADETGAESLIRALYLGKPAFETISSLTGFWKSTQKEHHFLVTETGQALAFQIRDLGQMHADETGLITSHLHDQIFPFARFNKGKMVNDQGDYQIIYTKVNLEENP